ncbi:MAG: sodium ion-translocating decarboxylase subunit beta [Clostridium sp.]|uniref:sodium ion-translocating decarboxylase subunit beta n=1 Tax=Clostridium sp. TaxID=1506 RepID=UPI0030362535
MNVFEVIKDLFAASGFAAITGPQVIMIGVSLFFMWLAIVKKFEPLLLLPIAFGMLMTNIPLGEIMSAPILSETGEVMKSGGLLYYLSRGVKWEIFPPLIFLGVGAMTDFGPLLANPSSVLMGAGAQFGIFFAFTVAILVGFTPQEAASIGIIGGADGPTAIFLTNQLAPHLLGPISVAAYSYMALVPLIQPPIMKALTTKEERRIKMGQLRQVKQIEKIIFPIVVAILVTLFLPSLLPLVGMLMLGNLFKESGVVGRLSDTAQNALINIVTIFLGLSVGATATAEAFINLNTIKIIVIGMAAFAVATAAGIIVGKLMCKITKGKINPLIGSAGVSAVPMAARVSQTVGSKEDSSNFLLMHAMGANVSGVIGSAIAAGILLTLFKVII